MEKKTFPLVVVYWTDIAGNQSYWNDDDDYGPVDVTSIGWLVFKSKKYISISQSMADDTGTGGILSVPTGVIRKIVKVKNVL